MAAILEQAALDGPLAPGATVELEYAQFRVEDAHHQDTRTRSSAKEKPSFSEEAHHQGAVEHGAPEAPRDVKPNFLVSLGSWSFGDDYSALAARTLTSLADPAPHLALEFLSPTTFRSQGKHLPIPLPELVFGSLLEKWNRFSPIAFDEGLRDYAAQSLAVERYELSTRAVKVKGGGLRVGALGQIQYGALPYDRYWMALLHVLAGFAFYAGVGHGASQGFGQVRQIAARGEGELRRKA